MTKKQRKQRLKSVKKAAQLFGTATMLAVPVALAVPGFASADPVAIPQPANLPVVIKSINSTLVNEYASKIKAGSNFQLDLSTIFEDAATLEYTVVVQNNSVADVKVTSTNKLAFNLKKTGSTMVDLIVHKPNESMSIHERFTLKVGANGALDPDQDGAGIADIIKYFNSHAGEFHSTGDYRTLLQAAVSSTVPTPNHAPIVSSESTPITMTAGTYTEIQLNDLFSDEDGDELSFELIDPPSSSSFVNAHLYSETSTLVLTAVNPSSQSLIVTVNGSDGEESATKQFSVTVGAAPVVNHAPVAMPASIQATAGKLASGRLEGLDEDANTTLTFKKVGQAPAKGALELNPVNGDYTYMPNAGESGADSFTFVVNDGLLDSDPVVVPINITPAVPVNHAPVANELSVVELNEDTTTSFQLGGTDEDEDELTAIIVEGKGPIHGELIASSSEQNKFTYMPDANYNGPDSFTYIVNDGTEDSEEVTVTITVNAVNDAPEANELSVVELNEDTTTSIQLGGTDEDEDELTAIIVEGKGPAHGQLIASSSEQNKFTYMPDANYNGPDSFTYIVNDGTEDSEEVTVTITVNAVNDAPEANEFSVVELNEDTTTSIQLGGTDADEDEWTAIIVEGKGPAHGELIASSSEQNKFTYMPDANYNGPDSFTYIVNDGTEDSEEVTVTITVNAVNDAPEANELSVVELNEDTTTSIQLGGTDEDDEELTAIIVEGKDPTHGELIASSLEQNKFTYIPDANYNGPDSFTYIVNDGTEDSEEVTVTITVNAVNDAPEANELSVVELNEDTTTSIQLGGTDEDEDELTAIIVEGKGPIHGELIASSSEQNKFTYMPDANYNGPDSFTYIVNDGTEDSEEITVTITVNAVNDAPEANELSVVELNEDTTTSIQLDGTDEDEDELTAIIVEGKGPIHGELIASSSEQNKFTYMPDANYNGPDSFTYIVNDGTEDSEEVTVTIRVNAVNDAPVANELSVVELNEDTTTSIQLGGTDADEDEWTAIIVEGKGPAHGELIASSSEQNKFTYMPDANYNGPDSFTYIVNDGTEDSEEVTVTIRVNAVNDAPVANEFSVVELNEDTTTSIQLGGTDEDEDELTAIIVEGKGPIHGQLIASSSEQNKFTYMPDANYNGPDSFTYIVNDGTEDSEEVTVTITVNAVNDAPTVKGVQDINILEDQSITGKLTGSDVEGDELTYRLTSAPPASDAFTLNEDGNYSFTPIANSYGGTSFTYVVNDGEKDSNESVVNINISAQNDAPRAQDISFEVNEGDSKEVSFNGWDADPGETSTLQYMIVDGPEYGTVTLDSPNPGQFTYIQNGETSASDSFTYRIYDGKEYSDVKTVQITIIDVNHQPEANELSVELNEDTTTSIQLGGTDADDEELTAIIVEGKGPAHGELIASSSEQNKFTYMPDENYYGTDSFTYIVNDGTEDSEEVTVGITINSVNDKPVASAISFEVDEDGSYVGTFTGTDADAADILSFVTASTPSHGTLSYSSLELNQFRYTPYEDYSGTDSFTYKANDGTEDSQVAAIVSITVKPVNDPPTANELSVDVNVGNSVEGNLWGEDLDEGDSLSYSIVTAPSHGTVTISSTELGHFTYQQDGSEQAFDSFTYRVYDGTGYSREATVSISIHSVNVAPVAEDFEIAVTGNAPYEDILRGGDADGDELTYSIYLSPGAGEIELDPETGEFTYTPMSGISGADSFAYQVYDGKKYSNIASVVISIAENELPAASDMQLQVPEDESHSYVLQGSDVNTNDVLVYSLVDGPQHGELIMNEPEPGMFTYTPAEGFSGTDSFTYVVNDGWGDSNTATVFITVGDGRPKAIQQTVETLEDEAVSGTLTGAGGNGAGLQFFLAGTKVKGDVTLDQETGEFTYTPNENANGVGSFTFKVYDGTSYSDEVTVTVNISPVDDEPIAGMVGLEGYIQLRPNQTAMLDLSQIFTEVDGQQLAYRTSFEGNSSLNGTLNGSSYYLNALGSPGFTSFDLQASDDGFETWVSAPVMVQVDESQLGSLPDVNDISNEQDEYTIDLANYFYGYFDYVAFDVETGAMLPIEESTLTIPLEDDDNVTVVVSARDGYGLTITDTFNLYVGLGVKDIGVQFFNNVQYYTDHNAHVYMKDIFRNADEFRVTAYNEDEVKSIGSYSLNEWTNDDYLSLWTDASFTNVSEILVEGRTLDDEGIETNVKSYPLKIRMNSAPYVDHESEMPTPLKKGETVELLITDAEGDPITTVTAQPDDSICGESGICISTTYANGILVVTGVETGTRSLRIATSDGLPFGYDSVYRYFTVYDDSIVLADESSVNKDLTGLLAGMNLGSLELQYIDSEYIIHSSISLDGTMLSFDVNTENMGPGDSEIINVSITDGNITRVLIFYMYIEEEDQEIDPGSA
ncbi:Ig-like domain-containing protein [Paenibacillus sp. BC26]|uniref:Ig-like domain-containing protein n=1 Tax=Paenibacillus sp. BC26 TaxID=1881032 RepID=UPI0008EC318E|nr:Ig-like domain-containing protein [Paenibacillus sp. BC26]SFT28061.1 VCBS repeat-containing protein [Paenibacillus sp. BC26]